MGEPMADPSTPVSTERGDDPSALTTQQALREDAHLQRLMEAKLEARFDAITTRLDGMDKALNRQEVIAGKVPSDIDIAIKRLEQLTNARFDSFKELVTTQFSERDTRMIAAAAAEVRRVDAAFSAQKESVEKTEKNFAELINTGRETQVQAKSSLEALINELKSRMDRGEGATKGAVDQRGFIMGAAGLAVAIVAVALTFLATRG